jgi:hypothetical protein
VTRTRKRFALWFWLVLVTCAALYPPWVFRGGDGPLFSGYSFVFSSAEGWVDFGRLGLEWIIATLVCAALYFSAPAAPKP